MRDGALDREMLGQTAQTAIRMLDNVIDINFYPTPEAKASNMRHRPIGLGLMGFQDALFQLRHPVRPRTKRWSSPTRPRSWISYNAHPGVVDAGRGAWHLPVLRGLEVEPRHLPGRHPRLARGGAPGAGRGRPDGASRLDAGAPARRRARHAQLEHHGDRADRDDLQHLGLFPVHRADLQEHLRQGQHLG